VIASKHIGDFMSNKISIYFLVFCMCGMATVKAADIEFDVTNVSHQFAGFGAQIWPGDMRVETIFTDLNMKYARMCPDGCSNPPTDATQAQMDTYVDSEYNGTNRGNNIIASLQMAENLDIQVILNMFGGPAAWLGTGNRLKSENFDDFARLWASQVYFFKSRGLRINYIELANEPEGNWNIYIPGYDYNTVVKLVRQYLDSRGLTDVGIVGPGLAYLYHGPTWISALDSGGIAALACWSTHAWDEGWGNTDALPSFLDQRWQDYFGAAIDSVDPTHSKPVIVTEYATGVRTYNGVTYGDTFTETSQFAQRSYENSLTLVNNGANVLCYWEAANQSWQTSPPMYGLLRTDSSLRVVYFALSTLAPHIPDGAMVISKTWDDPLISAAGFIGNNHLVLAFANSTAGTVNRTVGITGMTSFAITSAQAFESGAVVDKFSQVSFDYDLSTMDITLAPESTLTIAATVNECTAKTMGDVDGDCYTTLGDYSVVAADWLKDNNTVVVVEPEVIEDFESYADDAAMQTAWFDTTANVTVTVETTIVHNGSQSMKYDFANGSSPHWSKSGAVVPPDWSDHDTLSIWYNVASNGGNDDLNIKIVDLWGGALYTENFGAVAAGGGWQEATIDLAANLTPAQLANVGKIDIMMLAGGYGAGTVYFDDIIAYNGSSSSLVCSGEPDGDVNQDCVVDFSDILVLSDNWLRCVLIE
jgi:hypothetical protein